MALGVEHEQASIRKFLAAREGFLGRGDFIPHGQDILVPYNQAYQGRGQKDHCGSFRGGRRGQIGGGFIGSFSKEIEISIL